MTTGRRMCYLLRAAIRTILFNFTKFNKNACKIIQIKTNI